MNIAVSKNIRFHLFSFICITALTLFFFSPILTHISSKTTDDVDGLLGVWTINSVQDNIIQHRNIFYGNTFYPHQNTIIFSDLFITSALLSLPLRIITSDPITIFNYNVIGAQILSGFIAYLLFYSVLRYEAKVGKNDSFLFSFSLAVALDFAAVHVRYLPHLHMFALQYVLLGIFALFRFVHSGKREWIWLVAFASVLQMWQSFFLVYYIIFFICSLFFVKRFRMYIKKQWKTIIGSLFCFLILSFPIILTYLQFYLTYHVTRDIREAIHFSLVFKDLWGQFYSPIIYVIIVVSLILYLVKGRAQYHLSPILFLLSSIFIFILCLGPAWHVSDDTTKFILLGHVLHVPLPYALLYYVAPGFKAFRTPSRFFPLVLMYALIGSSSILIEQIYIKRHIGAICILIIGLTILFSPVLVPVQIPTRDQYPPYVHWLENQSSNIVIHLPMHDWADPNTKEEELWMLYSLEDGKEHVNGASGYFPREWLLFQNALRKFPSPETIQLLRKRGITMVIIENDFYKKEVSLMPMYLSAPSYQDAEVSIYKL